MKQIVKNFNNLIKKTILNAQNKTNKTIKKTKILFTPKYFNSLSFSKRKLNLLKYFFNKLFIKKLNLFKFFFNRLSI